jgi:hypothetical protein
MKHEKIRLGDIKFNHELLTMRKLNTTVISEYKEKLLKGEVFPSPILDKEHFLVSGHHTVKASIGAFSEDHVIDVIVKDYKNRKDMIADFARQNMKHGYPLQSFTKKLIIDELYKAGATNEEIGDLFKISITKIEDYGADMVTVVIGGGERIQKPCKRGFEPPREITIQEYKQHANSDRGIPLAQNINQIKRWLDGGFILADDRNISYIRSLRDSCDNWLKSVKPLKSVAV